MRRLRILTWHVHGNYLYYLAQTPHDFYVPVKPGRPDGYCGRNGVLPWPSNLYEVNADEVRHSTFDCVLFQSRQNYEQDQYEILSESQRQLPRIYLEHDPPQQHPTNTRHPVDDPEALLVHVTPFNRLMWDNGNTPSRVIEHGVLVPADVRFTGELARGVVVVNNIGRRGRRLGLDIFQKARAQIPLDLIGMDSLLWGGLGEIPYPQLSAFMSRYRFFFNPIRYTSLGLAVCEAMTVGLPIVGLATTEMVTAIENGVSGYVDTDIDRLIGHMQRLLQHPEEARRLGEGARRRAQERFAIQRFVTDWNATLMSVAEKPPLAAARVAGRTA